MDAGLNSPCRSGAVTEADRLGRKQSIPIPILSN
jgi:hypothetical protein